MQDVEAQLAVSRNTITRLTAASAVATSLPTLLQGAGANAPEMVALNGLVNRQAEEIHLLKETVHSECEERMELTGLVDNLRTKLLHSNMSSTLTSDVATRKPTERAEKRPSSVSSENHVKPEVVHGSALLNHDNRHVQQPLSSNNTVLQSGRRKIIPGSNNLSPFRKREKSGGRRGMPRAGWNQ